MESPSFSPGWLVTHLFSTLSLLLGPVFCALILVFYSVRRGRPVALPLLPLPFPCSSPRCAFRRLRQS